MKHFIYKIRKDSDKRGYNREITVYRLKNSQPEYVGYDDEINTASYKGDYAIACGIINKELGHKSSKGGYTMESKNIRIHSI